MALPREETCRNAAAKLTAPTSQPGAIRALIGLDGFVDEIIQVVDKRTDANTFEPIRTIDQMGRKILAAAGESSNYELLVTQQKLGGNGPIMANAMAAVGFDVAYIGNLGKPAVHPVFAELAKRAKVFSIAEPGHTDALEFSDGKLMLGKHGTLKDVNWANMVAGVGGLANLVALFDSARLVAMTNWTMLPYMSDIWENILQHVAPKLSSAKRTFFIDLADPEKRTEKDIKHALSLATSFQKHFGVILGLNLKEATQVAAVLGLAGANGAEADIEKTAREIRAKIGVGCVVIHPRRAAAAATAEASAAFAGPFVKEPKISTGAGDHFNAGFCTGQVLGLSLEESLCAGVATSGYYVRTAISPTVRELAEFCANLPAPQ